MPTATRVFNFSAGPAVLPLPVLEEAQRDLIALPGVGMSVMEISHRSKTFEDLLHKAQDDIRALAGVPASYRILMLQGRRQPAVLDGPDEPARPGRDRGLHRHGIVGRQSREGSEEDRQGQHRRRRPRRTITRAFPTRPRSC